MLSNENILQDRLISPKEAADILRISVRTLERWRRFGSPELKYEKIGHKVFYSHSAIVEARKRNTFGSSSEERYVKTKMLQNKAGPLHQFTPLGR